jgi:hypothetical protein
MNCMSVYRDSEEIAILGLLRSTPAMPLTVEHPFSTVNGQLPKHSENPVPSRPARLRVTPTSRGSPTPLRARPQNRHPRDVRLVGGKWECANCGAELDGVPKDSQPQVVMAHRSGAPSIRILKIGGAEIHRCEIESESA